MTPIEFWPLISGAGAIIFGAGVIVEKMRNGKYVRKDMCAQIHVVEKERWERIENDLKYIRKQVEKNETF